MGGSADNCPAVGTSKALIWTHRRDAAMRRHSLYLFF
jgi:hypothetical protein